MAKKVVLAYSGGLDTSAAIRWIKEKHGMDVIAVTADVGAEKDLEAVRKKALKVGAVKALVVDMRDTFVNQFVFPALQADAIYQGVYPLATALSRPLIARLLVEVAKKEGAAAVSHGCTGKGNDQVRFDVTTAALGPDLKVIAPARDWGMTREQTIAYAKKHRIPVPVTVASPYSIDVNLWGRSVECGVLEDPWAEPPEEVYAWTVCPEKAPKEPLYVEISFEKGVPTSLNKKKMGGVRLIENLNRLAGVNGVGRIDHIEDRLVGIKSREIYEAPAATVLFTAHKALEAMTLSKEQLRFKQTVAAEYASLIYNGLWFSSFHQDLIPYVQSTQRHVTGTVRVKLFKGNCTVVGRKSPYSLYQHKLATYDLGDQFDQSASPGFIQIWGLPVRVQSKVQPDTKKIG
jgi:argininosuccinate synthase